MFMWIHPVLMALSVLASVYVLSLGITRFRCSHMGLKGVQFQWKRHVQQGQAVLLVWAAGFLAGLGAAWKAWSSVLITDLHWQTGAAMLPLIAFGLWSGMHMDKVKARRKYLPLLHGAANTLLVLLAACQLYTGLAILRDMVMV